MDDRDVAVRWHGNSDVWARHVRAGYDTFRDHLNNPAFFALIGDIEGMMALDAGCGEGYNTRLLAKRGARMTGVDIAEGMIEQAQAAEASEPLGIRYEITSMAGMPMFANGQFDAVFSTMALMDCADYPAAVAEVFRVLRPGGMLAFSILHPCFVFHLEAREWMRDESGAICGLKLGDYFRRGIGEERWSFGSAPDRDEVELFTVVYFDRTLADYLNPLCDIGFVVEAIEEPYPSEEACEAEPRLRKHQLVPISFMVRARKASSNG